jgi:hypothetical protein
MFRKLDVELERTISAEALGWPESDMCEDDYGLGGNRECCDLQGRLGRKLLEP